MDELPRVSPSEQEGLKHILVTVICGSSTYKICMETALFQRLFFHGSTSQEVAASVTILRESVEAYVCRLWCTLCLSVFVTASHGML